MAKQIQDTLKERNASMQMLMAQEACEACEAYERYLSLVSLLLVQ